MRILILGAFQAELNSITRNFPDLQETIIAKRRCRITKKDNIEIAFSLSGLGTTAAACTTTALCEAYEPDFIILCGVAGGLEKDQKVGDLVLAKEILDADLHASQKLLRGTPYEPCLIDPHTLDPTTSEYKVHPLILDIGTSVPVDGLKIGTVVTSNVFPAPKELFAEIIKLGCSAIEMESVGVFKAAEYYGIPVMTIRAISNLLNVSGDDLGTELDVIAICSERIAIFLNGLLSNIHLLEPIALLNQQQKVSELVLKYDLQQHPEGGWYRQTFKSMDFVTARGDALERYNGEARAASTSIIYLLAQNDFSAWHTVQSDETWNFHAGDPLLLRVIDPETGELKEVFLSYEGLLQFTVKAGHIFSAESTGRFSLTGCMVTPGFDFKDFRLISQAEFIEKYPEYNNLAHLARDNPTVNVEDTMEVSQSGSNFFSKPSIGADKKGTNTSTSGL
jgi:uncharacterized protein